MEQQRLVKWESREILIVAQACQSGEQREREREKEIDNRTGMSNALRASVLHAREEREREERDVCLAISLGIVAVSSRRFRARSAFQYPREKELFFLRLMLQYCGGKHTREYTQKQFYLDSRATTPVATEANATLRVKEKPICQRRQWFGILPKAHGSNGHIMTDLAVVVRTKN